MRRLPRRVAICCAFLGSLSGAAPATLARQDPLQQRLDAVISTAVAEHPIVGAVLLVARDATVVYPGAAGLADREAARPMREDTIFNYSSVTKPIVTAAAMKLVEQRRIGLDDPVTRWLPDFKPKLADGSTPVITLR